MIRNIYSTKRKMIMSLGKKYVIIKLIERTP